MTIENLQLSNTTQNLNPLTMLQNLRAFLTTEEELVFMQLLFSSSSAIRGQNYGLKRKEAEKMLDIKNDDQAFYSFINRLNQAIARYFKVIYDEKRDQLIIMMRVPAKQAKTTLNKEALAILLYMFYQQEVLSHEFTLPQQLLTDFGHEMQHASRKLQNNIDILKKIGAVEEVQRTQQEQAYKVTAIGVHMFSNSFLRRATEFAQSSQLNKEEVVKFFRRYNLYEQEENQ
ncbi:hypothetical protein [Rummeliibacillus stabekisii]|uniref:Uncharacterized protein n=1 Tax=Rummeliibacillus stabekisii TaxID=241244 RepID=A0A143HCA7_9BACL|nr:hypothetical protein [Rummeliibacillus stabekisii]AMW99417.1 hypothetical protein ATY39_08010 [Rummeliibacillus stabekisii]